MKRISALFLSLVLAVSMLAGCTPEGKGFAENVQKATEMKRYHQFSTVDYSFNLAQFVDYFMMNSVSVNTDEELPAEAQRIVNLIKSYPEVRIHVEADALANNKDKLNPQLIMKNLQINIAVLGQVYRSGDIEVAFNDNKLYMSKNMVDFVKGIIVGVSEQVMPEEMRAEMLAEMEQTFAYINDSSEQYFVVDYDQYLKADNAVLTKQAVKQMNTAETLQLMNHYIEQVKEMDVELPITKKDNKYTLKLDVDKVIELMPSVLKALETFDFGDQEANKEIRSGLAKMDLDSQELQMALTMFKAMFNGTEMTISNSYKDEVYTSESAFDLIYSGEKVLDVNSYAKTEKLSKLNLDFAPFEKATDFMQLMENMPTFADKVPENTQP